MPLESGGDRMRVRCAPAPHCCQPSRLNQNQSCEKIQGMGVILSVGDDSDGAQMSRRGRIVRHTMKKRRCATLAPVHRLSCAAGCAWGKVHRLA